jgi:3-isopropylmalate dehydratase small subunit
LRHSDIDIDQNLPKQYMKKIERTGYLRHLEVGLPAQRIQNGNEAYSFVGNLYRKDYS